MNEKLENFLLYGISDDWAAVAEFDGNVKKISPEIYSRSKVLEIIREIAERGYIQLGAFPGGGRSWEPWDVSIDVAMDRIAHGYNGVAGYMSVPEDDIGSNEVFRAAITDGGRERLRELGDPYEKYGDPWSDDPLLRVDL
ncbi:hypothetical protein ACFQZZ_20775 [Nocardia sp. GCM10030253]|uniref:hypothetical protein n=1 Tax=Nocardia sp. GCM10030253 TaxID=3273404 RepID=UPI00362DF6D0